jgi:hypothetical protein
LQLAAYLKSSIEKVPEIGTMGSTAAFLVPWLRTFSDQLNLFVTLFFGDWSPNGSFLITQKTVPVNLNRINTTVSTEIVGLNTLIAHIAAGNGRYPVAAFFTIQFFSAFCALYHYHSIFLSRLIALSIRGNGQDPAGAAIPQAIFAPIAGQLTHRVQD